ncbi:MAG: RimK family alpha-L-glutamate ligase [Fluviicola sp.]
MQYDLTILTDRRYVDPTKIDDYTQNVLDEDSLLAEACERIGLKVHRTNWDDPEMDWTTTRFAIFRTTWDYFERFPEFASWLEKVQHQTKLINSKDLIFWNLDKKYLKELEGKRVRIPGTIYLEKGTKESLHSIVKNSGWQKCILKPAVSGAARHTYKFEATGAKDYDAIFNQLIAEENMMLQEYQHQITTKGEVSYMLFGGKYSHAILKKAKRGDFRVQDDFGGTLHEYLPNQEEINFAEFALAQCPELPVYARVDVFWNNDDQLVLGELELIEPELWFRKCSTAADACAAAIHEFMLSN